LSIRMCLAHLNQHRQSHFLVSHVASSGELISSNCGDSCCFSTFHNLFVGVNSVTKTNIMQSILGELNTYEYTKRTSIIRRSAFSERFYLNVFD